MGIDGAWFDARQSRPQRAVMHFYANGQAAVELPGRHLVTQPAAALQVSARIGRIPRRITFPDGAVFETDDNNGIDEGLRIAGITARRTQGWIDALESRWQVALWSLALVAVGSVAFVKLGLPAMADFAAFRTPMTVERSMGK